jgi:hypothetical protein
MRKLMKNHRWAVNMSKLIEINGKLVQLREPYKARTVPLVGTERYIKML